MTCECQYCKLKSKEKVCCSCGYNFNRCESKFGYVEQTYGDLPVIPVECCPKCVNDEKPIYAPLIGFYVRIK